MNAVSTRPLILLPGLGADARMYREQKKAFPQLVVPNWIEPLSGESLQQYAKRFAREINPGKPFFLGGSSLGGIIALEMSRYINPDALFLFACGRSHKQMTPWLRKVRSLAALSQILPWNTASLVSELGLTLANPVIPSTVRSLMKHLHHREIPFVKWGLHAVLRWESQWHSTDVRVHHLHGEKDPFFPARLSGACEIVAGAGHLLTRTHHDAVTRFIAARIDQEVPHSCRTTSE